MASGPAGEVLARDIAQLRARGIADRARDEPAADRAGAEHRHLRQPARQQSISHSSAIAASGSSSASKNPDDPFRNSPSLSSAPLAAKQIAHTSGTARHTKNARASTRGIHEITGESTIAIGIPTNTSTVEIATATFIINSPRNRMLATTAITIDTNNPTPRNPSPTPAPTPTASRFALDFVTLADPNRPVLASLAKRHRGVEHPRPHRQQQRRADGARQPLERRAAAPRDPGDPEPGDRDRRDRTERRARHRQHRPLRRRDVRAGRRVVGHRHQPADQLRVDEMRDRREQRMDDRVKRRHRQLPDRPADHMPDPTQQPADHLPRARQPQEPRLRWSRLSRRDNQHHDQRARTDRDQQQPPSRTRDPASSA